MTTKATFSFGKNWQNYLKHAFNAQRLNEAQKSLIQFIGTDDFKGKTFIDIGCGTGMFSLAAYKLGASQVISVDIDPFSIHCTKLLHARAKKPTSWKIIHGSILDKKLIAALPSADIVYSWGVLHHTGKMWEALDAVTTLVKKDGYLYIAIYNKLDGLFGSRFWLSLKKKYNAAPKIGKKIIEFAFISAFFAWNFLTLQNPFKKIKNYKSKRGMSWYYDVIDGLGGYPYEFASVEEIFHFYKKRNFELLNIKTTNGIENNEFLFRKIE